MRTNKRLRAIDFIMDGAALSYGNNAVEGEEGGIVTIFLGTFEEAERLHNLLVGVETEKAAP